MKDRTLLAALVLAALGAVAGIAIGLVLGWVVWPVNYDGAKLLDLAPQDKEAYIVLVGAAYNQDRDLDKARERLAGLEVPNAAQWVAELADTYIREGRDQKETGYLVALANGLDMASPAMLAYLPTNTPVPTDTPTPTPVPTDTPVPPTDTPEPPTDVPPTDLPTVAVPPTDTAVPPTNTPKPTAKATAKPTAKPTAAPTAVPTKPAAKWSWSVRLVGPGEDGQSCTSGNLQIHVTVVNAGGQQIGGVWVYDKYSGQYQVTGNVGSPDWGPGETKFEYGRDGGGSLCIASSEGGPCETGFTRDMPCFASPPFEDKWAAGYCQCCSPEAAANKELCQQLYDAGNGCINYPGGHYTWRVLYKRGW